VIFLTALDELEHKLKGFRMGAVDYVTKPLQEEEMLARINTHLRLQELKERLEEQVRLRTDELSAAVVQAEQLNQRLEREIAEHERAEAQRDATLEALRESQARFHSIYAQAAVGIGRVSIEGLWLEVNPMICNITGYTAEELVGHPCADITHPKDIETVLANMRRLIEGQVDRIYIVARYLHKHGSSAWINLSATLVNDAQGEPAYLVIVANDITEQVRIGAEREALIAELEAKNKELERFTYTVSHDLKSPLVTIKGFLGFLKQDVQAGDDEKVQTDIASISSAADKMQQLLDELLELSRIGRVIKQPETALLGELAQEALDTVAGRVAERGVEVNVAPDLLRPDGPTVFGDRLRLREALENLLDNAVKYMGEQPRPRVEIGVRQDDKDRVFYVRDNGIGIESRYHQRIFGLFDKLDPESEGVGVGLAVVKRIVEVHGGRVWVESVGAGQGSTFCFTLPRDQTRGDQGKIRRTH
jgi:PAS domain S-box-containing protein